MNRAARIRKTTGTKKPGREAGFDFCRKNYVS
jgi:hypothetical protein